MFRFILFGFFIFLLNVTDATATDFDFTKIDSPWKNDETGAYKSVKGTHANGDTANHTFMVVFEPDSNCTPVFAFSSLDGRDYGALLKQNMEPKGLVKIYVDSSLVYDNFVVSSNYSNGIEFGAPLTVSRQLSCPV